MANSARGEEGSMMRTPPAPEELARQLLSYETEEHQSSEDLVVAAERAYGRLRERLMVFLGQRGFDSLWTRAMHLAQRKFPWDETEGAGAPMMLPTGWPAAMSGRDPDETRDVLVAVLASFIALLFTFIGEDLGFRLIRQVWPELPLGEAGAHVEEATP